jgi:hypothetical protein
MCGHGGLIPCCTVYGTMGDLVLFKHGTVLTALQYLGNTVAACHLRCRLVMIGAQAEGDGVGFEVQYWCYWYQVLVLI